MTEQHRPCQSRTRCPRGFTLIEVLMTVVIIGILGAVALRSIQGGVERERFRETEEEMQKLVWAIAGNPNLYANGMRMDFGYIGDIGALPSSLDDLVTRPSAGYSTWKGPYYYDRFDENGQSHNRNAWGNAYTYTNGITISTVAGDATTMTKSAATQPSDLTSTVISGVITDAAGNLPGDSAVAVTVTVTYPDGVGGTTSASTSPSGSGAFAVPGMPVGIRKVEADYRATSDTVTAYACALPEAGAYVVLRFPGDPFAVPVEGGSGTIEYVDGSADLENANSVVIFDITNVGTASVAVDWLIATYTPVLYFGQIQWDGVTIFSETNPRAGSGDTCSFTATQVIPVSDTVTVKLLQFRNSPTGGVAADASNVDFTITFSDGSEISFNSGS